ncbi:MAG: flagellar assembly protein FliH [Pseudomonadota bacterium]
MSDFQPSEFDRHESWRRWKMDELAKPVQRSKEPESPAAIHRRKVAAAQKAAEEARQREEQARKAEYQKIRQQAEQEGYQAGFKRGQQEGHAEGLEAGQQEAKQALEQQISQTLTPLAHLAKQFDDALARLDESLADDLVKLALLTGRQLAGEALEAKPEEILRLVRQLLHTEPPLVGQQRLWLNPEDHALVSQHLADELNAANWKLQPDDQLARGGCRVTSAQGELDATFESRWQAINAHRRQRHHKLSKDNSASEASSDDRPE